MAGMRPTSFARSCLPALLLACGPGDGRDQGETSATTLPGSGTDVGGSSGTSTGGSTGEPAPTSSASSGGASSSGGTTAQISGTSSGDSSSGDGTSGGAKLDLAVPEPMPIPVHDIPGLESITFYETTGKVTEYTFAVAGPELITQLADPLGLDNRDIQGTSVEFYDVYYSEEDGSFNPDGSYTFTPGGDFDALAAGQSSPAKALAQREKAFRAANFYLRRFTALRDGGRHERDRA